ncbi:MAG: VOC family protein [Butyricicoccus pullicaecorum]|nr:VOC family protein [Butyricicoccus pullicaecorum]
MKHYKGLAHIAVYTTDLSSSIRFYEALGGICTMRGEVQKKTGVNQLAMIHLVNFEIELIEPGDGTVVTAGGGVLPHFAIEVEDLPSVIDTLRAMGIDTFCAEQPNVLPELFGGLQNIFFRGPSGEMIELIEHFDMESSER